jgi:hypothetical protein
MFVHPDSEANREWQIWIEEILSSRFPPAVQDLPHPALAQPHAFTDLGERHSAHAQVADLIVSLGRAHGRWKSRELRL